MQLTGSISRGKTAEKHNTRECYREGRTPENIDRTRSAGNVVLENRTLEEVYADCFGAAAEAYNASQVEKGHPERQIPNYLEKVRSDKKLKPMYEFVVQVGNVDAQPPAEVAVAVYREWLGEFKAAYGAHFAVKQAIVHMDEATPHMHVEVVPVAESKRGLSVQNSMNKAVKQCGFSDYKAMLAGWDEILTGHMAVHGIERVAGDKERQMGGVDINTYRRSMAVKAETQKAEERLECLRQEVEKLEPSSETVAESAGALWKGRGAGSREDALGEEVEGLRSRISGLERDNQGARERLACLDGRVRELRDRLQGLRGRFDALGQRVWELVSSLLRVPDTLSDLALDMAEEAGKSIYSPNSLSEICAQATAAAQVYNEGRHERGEVPEPRRTWSR